MKQRNSNFLIRHIRKIRKIFRFLNFRSLGKKYYLAFFILTLLHFVVLSPILYFDHEDYQLESIASKDIYAPFQFKTKDISLYTLKKNNSRFFFRWNQDIPVEIMESIDHIYSETKQIARTDLKSKQKTEKLKQIFKTRFSVHLTDRDIQQLLKEYSNQSHLKKLEQTLIKYYENRVVIHDPATKNKLLQYKEFQRLGVITKTDNREVLPPQDYVTLSEALKFFQTQYDTKDRQFLYHILVDLLDTNFHYDHRYTNMRTQQELNIIADKSRVISTTHPMIEANKEISLQDLANLEKIDELMSKSKYHLSIGLFLIICINLIIQIILLKTFKPHLPINVKNLFISSLANLLVLVIGRFFITVMPKWGNYWILTPLATLLNYTIFGKSAAVILCIHGAVWFAILTNFSAPVIIASLLSSMILLAFTYRIKERKDFILAGLLAGFSFGLIIQLIDVVMNPQVVKSYGLIGIMNGILSGALTLVICPLFEYYFRINTQMRLLELTNPQNKLLQEFKKTAKGTFQHSQEVSELLEYISEELDADLLLLRAGALYHDIGKMANPEFFTENQPIGSRNPHADLDPFTSAEIIIGHLEKGVNIARKHHFPSRLIEFIQQHHGMTKLDVFYKKACQDKDSAVVNQDAFTYPGPKPQCFETALLHLADSISAAIKSLDKIDEDAIYNLVTAIIDTRLAQGQFDESPLTFKDLSIVKQRILSYYELKLLKKRVNYAKEKKKYED